MSLIDVQCDRVLRHEDDGYTRENFFKDYVGAYPLCPNGLGACRLYWNVFNDGSQCVVQRVDEPMDGGPAFRDDAEAQGHAVRYHFDELPKSTFIIEYMGGMKVYALGRVTQLRKIWDVTGVAPWELLSRGSRRKISRDKLPVLMGYSKWLDREIEGYLKRG